MKILITSHSVAASNPSSSSTSAINIDRKKICQVEVILSDGITYYEVFKSDSGSLSFA